MEAALALFALLLMAVLGISWVALLVPAAVPHRRALVLGYGVLSGLIAVPLLMRLLDMVGFSISFRSGFPVVALGIVAALLLLCLRRSGPGASRVEIAEAMGAGQRVLFILLFLLIASRIGILAAELLGRPLFPWDATMHWATKARVWFETGQIETFVENQRWLELGGEGVFTDHHPGYPITIPLLQVWMTSAAGTWDESLMNLPWVLCMVGLGLAFYGQLRAAGAAQLPALVFSYFLLSMPLLNTHVALAGYADLFLGAVYCAALMAFHNWSCRRESWQGALAVFFALSCLLIKNEGFYWLLTLVPALALVSLPMSRSLPLLAVLAVVLLSVLLLIPGDFEVAGHSLDRLRIFYRAGTLAAIAASIFSHDNWHLFGYLLLAALPLALVLSPGSAYRNRGILMALAAALVLYLILFTLTGYAVGAKYFTAVGRISLQLVPGMLFLVALCWLEISGRRLVEAAAVHRQPHPS